MSILDNDVCYVTHILKFIIMLESSSEEEVGQFLELIQKNLTQVKPVDPHIKYSTLYFFELKLIAQMFFFAISSHQPQTLVFYLICSINLARLLSCLEIDSEICLEMFKFLIFSTFLFNLNFLFFFCEIIFFLLLTKCFMGVLCFIILPFFSPPAFY